MRQIGEKNSWASAGFGVVIEDRVVARRVLAQDDSGTGRGFDAEGMRANRHVALSIDIDGGAQAPDKRPPGAVGFGAQDGAFFFKGQVPSLLGGHFEFAMDLGGIVMETQFVDVGIGCIESGDPLRGEIGRQSVLPILVLALDFAFGLRGRSVAEGDAVKFEGLAQGGEGLGCGAEEKGVIVDVEGQRQAVAGEGLGQKIKISQQDFPLVDLRAGKEAAAVIQEVEHGEELARVGKVGMRRGIQLPELTDAVALPAPNDSGGWAQPGRLGQVVLDGPAADLGTVDFELKAQQHLAGSKAVGRRGAATQARAQEPFDVRRPIGGVIATGAVGLPDLVAAGPSRQGITVEPVEAAARNF